MITQKDKEVSVYRGDYRPVEALKNGKKLHGYNITGTIELEAEFENTYNDSLFVCGKSGYGSCKNLCPPPESNTTNDGLIYTSISKKINGKFDLQVTQVDNSGAVMLMSPLVIHSATLPAGTYTASTNLTDIGFCSDDEDLYDLPYTFTLDSEQTVYFGTYNIEIDENDVYIQVEKGEIATEYEHYFDPDKDPSPENIKSIISSGGKVETFGQNLFYKGASTKPTTTPISCVWDEKNQTITLNGTASKQNAGSGYNIVLSTPVHFGLNEGEDIINIRYLISGKCTLEGTAKLLWSVFSNNTTQGNYYSARILEGTHNMSSSKLQETGVVPVDSGKGYQYVLQVLTGTDGIISFDNAVYKIQILKGTKSKLFLPYFKPSAVEIADLNGLESDKEQNYKEETDGQSKFYLSDSLEGSTLVQRIGKKVFTGYDSFEAYNELDKTIGLITVDAKCGNGTKARPICNAFVTLDSADSDEEGIFITEEGRAVFRLNKERGINSSQTLKSLLADYDYVGVPITVFYPLNEDIKTSAENSVKTFPWFTRVKTTISDGKMPFGLADCIKTE